MVLKASTFKIKQKRNKTIFFRATMVARAHLLARPTYGNDARGGRRPFTPTLSTFASH